MNIHQNAQTNPYSRALLVARIDGGWTAAEVATSFGISVRTVRKGASASACCGSPVRAGVSGRVGVGRGRACRQAFDGAADLLARKVELEGLLKIHHSSAEVPNQRPSEGPCHRPRSSFRISPGWIGVRAMGLYSSLVSVATSPAWSSSMPAVFQERSPISWCSSVRSAQMRSRRARTPWWRDRRWRSPCRSAQRWCRPAPAADRTGGSPRPSRGCRPPWNQLPVPWTADTIADRWPDSYRCASRGTRCMK